MKLLGVRKFLLCSALGAAALTLGGCAAAQLLGTHTAVSLSAEVTAANAVHGVVRAEGNPVAGVTVRAGSASAVTDEHGAYTLPNGEKYLTFEKEGYYTTTSYHYDTQSDVTWDVTLTPETAFSPLEGGGDGDFWMDIYTFVETERLKDGLMWRIGVIDYDLCADMVYSTDEVPGSYAPSDNVEIYIDSGATFNPVPADGMYGMGIYPNGKFRIFAGNSATDWWRDQIGIFNFNVTPMGEFDDGIRDKGYKIELLLPYETFGFGAEDDITFSIANTGAGERDKSTYQRFVYNRFGVWADEPLTYQLLTPDGIYTAPDSEPCVIDETYLGSLATLDAERIMTFEPGNFLWDDWGYKVSRNIPAELDGKAYVYGTVRDGSEGRVRTEGYVLALIPAVGPALRGNYFDGWEKIVSGATELADNQGGGAMGPVDVYVKWCTVGEELSIPFRSVLLFEADDETNYHVHEWDRVPARIYAPNEYTVPPAHWYGVGSSQMLSDGTLIVAYMSGGLAEPDVLNYILVDVSRDEGQTWQRACYIDGETDEIRAWSPRVWQAPDGTVWLGWSQSNDYIARGGVWMCKITGIEEDCSQWQYSTPKRLYDGENMTKPIAVTEADGRQVLLDAVYCFADVTETYIYESYDNGETWALRSTVDVGEEARFCHEGTLVDLGNGTIWLEYRATSYPAGESYSYDYGKTWTKGRKSYLKATYSLSCFHKAESGSILFVTNDGTTNLRENLTVYLIDHRGKGGSWAVRAKLLLEPRDSGYPDLQTAGGQVTGAYPSVSERNGKFYIVWDFNRNGRGQEVLAVVTEERIRQGGSLTEDDLIVFNKVMD